MTFTLTIQCDNAAFEDVPAIEVARILHQFAARLEYAPPPFERCNGAVLRDINGNTVGRVTITHSKVTAPLRTNT